MKNVFQLDRRFKVLWSGQFLAIAGLTVMVPLLPFYLNELGAVHTAENRLWSGLSLAAPAITFCLVSPIWGRIGDRWGRKWMVVRALFGLAISLILMGLSQTPLQFFLCRLLQGAFGGVVDAASAYAAAETTEGDRGRILGILQSATAAGSLAGPVIGGIMADFIGFRSLLCSIGILTGVSGLVAARVLRESTRSESAECPKTPVYRVFVDLLSNSRLRPFLIAGICSQIGIFGFVIVFGPHVEGLNGTADYAPTWVGVLQAIAWGAGLVGAPWWGMLNDRSKIERNFFMAIAGCGVSIVLQSIPEHAAWLIPLRILQGFCFSAILQSIILAVTKESKEENTGERVGAANSILVFGQIVGSLLGALLGGFLPTQWIIVIMGCLFLIGAVWIKGIVNWHPGLLSHIPTKLRGGK
ncbi:MFS transporter [Effusibacillus consociatus]|uniref:MFS transporter n=1 Tax=Effusibacillus consociatus TaxID=1117041 RepID=A0ABV9PZW4_9BACL